MCNKYLGLGIFQVEGRISSRYVSYDDHAEKMYKNFQQGMSADWVDNCFKLSFTNR